uniref:ZP domain-containing protein n=1 Tax=Plectus sambesii TaxID=2011161 RepID=A0A914UKZ1_9BILA
MNGWIFRLIAVIASILLSCSIPTEAQGDVAISSLVCMSFGMEITVEYKFLNDYFPNWNNTGVGFFVDGASPVCAQTAPEVFISITSPPFTFTLNFTDCNINITKHYDNNHELVSYTALVNGRFTALKNFADPSSPDFRYTNVTVPLYCDWNAEQNVTGSIGVVPTVPSTVLPTVYGNYSIPLVMNTTTADSVVLVGDKIRIAILLVPDDGFSFVAELPMECTITNADNPDDAKLYTVYDSCPFWNISQFFPSLNFTAYKKNSSDFFFDFDAFTFYEGQPSTLLIECKVQLCLDADDCNTVCWPESNETTFLTAKSRLGEVKQNSATKVSQVNCTVHVLPRTLTSTSPPQTPYPQLSSTQSTSAIYKTNLTALYIVLGVVLVTAFVLCIVLSVCFIRPRRSHSDKKQIFRDPYRLT